jgi:hypothetical protein
MSTLRTNTLSNVAGTASTAIENAINGSAKAWVNFNGTGTVAIRAQHNVSSITDNGTGDYTVNFTNAMPDANYSVVGVASINLVGNYGRSFTAPFNQAPTTAGFRLLASNGGGSAEDCLYIHASIFR